MTKKVDETIMDDKVVKVSHEALREVMKGWKGVGKRGDKNPEVVMIVPCSVKDQHPVEGKGYMLCVGKKLAQSRSEVMKSDPETAIDGPVVCGYTGCTTKFFQALQRWNEDSLDPAL